MAEKLKEFFNGTKTAADIVGDRIPLVVNDATTQAVIKDITVISKPNETSKYTIGNTELGDFESVAGSEILDVNSSFDIKLIPVPSAFYENNVTVSISKNGANIIVENSKFYTDDNYSTLALVNDLEINKIPPSMNIPSFIIYSDTIAYYFYYDGNSITQLLTATVTGGNIGTWTYVNATNYQYIALDSETNNMYFTNGDYLKKVTFGTAVVSDIVASGLGWIASSTYTHSAFVNNIFFYQPSSGTNTVFYYNVSTADSGSFTFLSPSTNTAFAAIYNPDEDRYFLLMRQSTTWTCKGYDYTGSSFSLADDTFVSGDFPTTGAGFGHMQGNIQGMFIGKDNTYGSIYIGKISSANKFEKLYTLTNTETYMNYGVVFNNPTVITPKTVNDYDISIPVRVTGVEITGV